MKGGDVEQTKEEQILDGINQIIKALEGIKDSLNVQKKND